MVQHLTSNIKSVGKYKRLFFSLYVHHIIKQCTFLLIDEIVGDLKNIWILMM